MGKEIELDELPKSKEFIKHAKIADGLTKETGLEHGFVFCKPNDKIIVDKMCVGNKCSIIIKEENCKQHENTFHTHPHEKTDFSIHDVWASLSHTYSSEQPRIECTKGANDINILCEKDNIEKDWDKMLDIIKIKGEIQSEWKNSKFETFDEIDAMSEKEQKAIQKIYEIANTKHIRFNSKSGKIIAGNKND